MAASASAWRLSHSLAPAATVRSEGAIGLIRTSDTTPYANLILVSG